MTETSLQQASEAAKQPTSKAEVDLWAARKWFATAVPSHIDPDQYLAVLLGVIRRNDKLREAAEQSPDTMLIAAAECARLGLVPGETYHFVPFYNKKTSKHEVVGIIDYKGEIDLIYRAGGVESVHAEVVREHDKFLFRPGMRLPEHEIAANPHGQIGLSDNRARGILTGVYSFARLRGGGLSQIVVMSVDQVAKHRAVAKTHEMWGPEWPDETEWTENMWLKTALHGLPKWVPTSPEYVGELWRAAVAVTRQDTPLAIASAPADTDGPPALGRPQATIRAAVEAGRSGARGAARTRQPAKQQEGGGDGAQASSGAASGTA